MKALGIILAGGNSSRMGNLSDKRAISAMPVGGSYRGIDFALSNMTNSHIQTVAVLSQYNARSLNEHLASSKWWNFGRKQGGLFVFTPTVTTDNSWWYRGTADAMWQNIDFLKKCHEPYVIIASGDGIYKIDFNAFPSGIGTRKRNRNTPCHFLFIVVHYGVFICSFAKSINAFTIE